MEAENTNMPLRANVCYDSRIPLQVNTCYSANMPIQAYGPGITGDGDDLYAEIEGPENDYDYVY